MVGILGFADALRLVGWLDENAAGTLEIPNFQAHNGDGAKKRAMTHKRVTRHRDMMKRESVTREEKRREAKNNNNPPISPQGGDEKAGGGAASPRGPKTQQVAADNPLWVEVASRWFGGAVPRDQVRRVNRIVTALADRRAVPEEIGQRIRRYRSLYPEREPPTPEALVKFWADVAPPPAEYIR
jgi:hypothetical protein